MGPELGTTPREGLPFLLCGSQARRDLEAGFPGEMPMLPEVRGAERPISQVPPAGCEQTACRSMCV